GPGVQPHPEAACQQQHFGIWTATRSALPTTDPHESAIASEASSTRPPYRIKAAIMAKFQTTGEAYDTKNLRWLLRIPKHQAERTSKPAPGKSTRVSRIV